MELVIDISEELEKVLRIQWGGNLEQAAKDALLIESYRAGKISVGYLAQLLEMSRWDAEKWLASHGVTWNYGLDDLEADRRTIAELSGR